MVTKDNNEKIERAFRVCKCDELSGCKSPVWKDPVTTGCNFKVINDSKITLTLSKLFQVKDLELRGITLITIFACDTIFFSRDKVKCHHLLKKLFTADMISQI